MNYIVEIKQILAQARQKSYQAVNSAMVEAYWLIGKRKEQFGKLGNFTQLSLSFQLCEHCPHNCHGLIFKEIQKFKTIKQGFII